MNFKQVTSRFAFYLLLILLFVSPISINYYFSSVGVGLTIPSELISITLCCLFPSLFYLYRQQYRINLLDKLILAHLIILFISSVFSDYTQVSVKYSITVVWYVIAGFYSTKLLLSQKIEKKPLLIAYLSGHLILTAYSLFRFIDLGIFYETSYLVSRPFVYQGHSNLSVLLEPVLLFLIAIILQFLKEKKDIKLAVSMAFMTILVIFFSCSRTSYVSIFLSVSFFFLLLPSPKTKKTILKIIIPIIVLAIGIWKTNDYLHYLKYKDQKESFYKNNSHHYDSNDISTYKQTPMLNEMLNITNVNKDKSNSERLNRWKSGLGFFKKSPFLGIGPGSFSHKYYDKVAISSSSNNKLTYVHMNIHNLYLSWLVEGGVLVFLSGLSIMIYITISIIKKWRIIRSSFFHIALLASFLTFFFHGIVQDYWNEPRVAILFWVGLAMIDYQINVNED